MAPGQMTCNPRRLRPHCLIERLPGTHRYRVTRQGGRTAMCYTRTDHRILHAGLAQIIPEESKDDLTPSCAEPSTRSMERSDHWIERNKINA